MNRWSVAAGRQINFDGKPFVHIAKEGDTEPVEADGVAHFFAQCLNQANVTPDDIWERHMGHPRRRPKHAREVQESRPQPREATAGFAITVEGQHTIEDNARDRVDSYPEESRQMIAAGLIKADGEITQKGWDQINADIGKIERNSMAWMRQKFQHARDEGHDSHDDLVGTFWFNPDDPEHAYLVDLASQSGRNERVDMIDASYGDLSKTAFDGVSDFGGGLLGGAIYFFDVQPEDMEAVEATLSRGSKRGGAARRRAR